MTTAGPEAGAAALPRDLDVVLAAAFGLGLAMVVVSGFAGRSALISSAGLSLRSPLKAACRTLPSAVQPANSISATSSGRAQCMLASLRGLAPAANGLLSLSTALSLGSSS